MAWLNRTTGVRDLPCRRDFFLFIFLFILGAVHGEHERHSAKHRQNRSHKRSFLDTGKLFISFTFQLRFPVVRPQVFFFFPAGASTAKAARRVPRHGSCKGRMPYQANPMVCRVGWSTADVTARPWSAWKAASAARVCGPRIPSIAPA